jgi:hypothetical protein
MVVIHNMFLTDIVVLVFPQSSCGPRWSKQGGLWTLQGFSTPIVIVKMPGKRKRDEDEDSATVGTSAAHGFVQARGLVSRLNRLSYFMADRQYLYPIFHIQQLLPIYRRFFLTLHLSKLRSSYSTRRRRFQKAWGTSPSPSKRMQRSACKMERWLSAAERCVSHGLGRKFVINNVQRRNYAH